MESRALTHRGSRTPRRSFHGNDVISSRPVRPPPISHDKMAKRTADLTWVLENYGEREPPCQRTARSRASPKLLPPLYKASVKEFAETGTIRVSSFTAHVGNTIIQRIKKCLERANHPSTPEAEAKAALHLASRLIGQYNVSQAEVLAHEPPSAQRQYAGQSVVSNQRVDGDKPKAVKHQSYVDTLFATL